MWTLRQASCAFLKLVYSILNAAGQSLFVDLHQQIFKSRVLRKLQISDTACPPVGPGVTWGRSTCPPTLPDSALEASDFGLCVHADHNIHAKVQWPLPIHIERSRSSGLFPDTQLSGAVGIAELQAGSRNGVKKNTVNLESPQSSPSPPPPLLWPPP